MRPNFIPYILLISTCILAACSGPLTSSPPAPESAQLPPTPAPEDTTPEEMIPEDALIVYRRSGGFAGLDEEWIIYSDGRVTTKDGRQWHAPPEEANGLMDQLESLGFFELKADPVPMVPCCDRFYYELTVSHGERTKTVATYDGATATPPSVWQAMEAVVKFLEQIQKQPE